MKPYVLRYFLVDDTIQITDAEFESNQRRGLYSSSRAQEAVLLRRQRLPKGFSFFSPSPSSLSSCLFQFRPVHLTISVIYLSISLRGQTATCVAPSSAISQPEWITQPPLLTITTWRRHSTVQPSASSVFLFISKWRTEADHDFASWFGWPDLLRTGRFNTGQHHFCSRTTVMTSRLFISYLQQLQHFCTCLVQKDAPPPLSRCLLASRISFTAHSLSWQVFSPLVIWNSNDELPRFAVTAPP